MADAQLMEEELQQSVLVLEGDAEYEREDGAVATGEDGGTEDANDTEIGPAPASEEETETDRDAQGEQPTEAKREDAEDEDAEAEVDDEAAAKSEEDEDDGDDDDDEEQDEDAEGEEDDEDAEGEEDDEDAEGEEDDEDAEGEEDDEVFEDDVEGEEYEDALAQPQDVQEDNPSPEGAEDAADAEEDEEGVGAVKLRPDESDDGESEDDDASGSAASDDDSEDDAEWEDAEEHGEGEDEEEESENESPNTCMFCKQDEENDPGEEFETFLTCPGCSNNAHQQCARDHDALDRDTAADSWRCPGCASDEPDSDSAADDAGVSGVGDADLPPATGRATAPKLARYLLPAEKATTNPDSHSVFNQLVLDEDPMDGSRVLRKRKTSSAEADESVMSLRKRRRSTNEAEDDDDLDGADGPARPRSARLKAAGSAVHCTIIKRTRTALVMKMRVKPAALRQVLSQEPKGEQKRRGSTVRASRSETSRIHVSTLTAPFVSANYSQPFYSFFDKETDELKAKPYGGILTEVEADTSKTLPTNDDRRRFDETKQRAEEEWRNRILSMQAEDELPVKKSKKSAGPASQIECIEFGGWEIDTWYAAPYPEEYSRNRVLYICEFCLKYMNSDYVAWRHKLKCPAKHPPGDEIYRSGSVSVFEVDGRKNPVYCQNLCLLAKLFLGSKTLYYDVEPFLFYVLCEYDDLGYHFVGYFSKEKRASSQNNVSCILTLPIHQRKGYGNLLIDFSYLLTRVERKTGSPEKPLSDMGLVSYRNYWRLIMCRYLLEHVPEDNKADKRRGLSIKQISDDTGLTADDVVSGLEGLRCLVRDPQTELYAFRADLAYCREYVARWERKKYITLDADALTWTPYVMGRSVATNFELGPLNTIAPREEDEEQGSVVEEVAPDAIPNGDVLVPDAAIDGVVQKTEMDVDSTVLQSTEPNETGSQAEEEGGGDGDGDCTNDKQPAENGTQDGGAAESEDRSASTPTEKDEEDDWASAYKDIPASRFQVFPALSGTRRLDRPRGPIGRPPGSRTGSVARPKYKRATSSARRTSTVKRKSSGSRSRPPGGTGRGPGRWPKGTKKSDYGNASSGPGLPPGWFEKQRFTTTEANMVGGDATGDTVEVKVPPAAAAAAAAANGNGKASPRSKAGKAAAAVVAAGDGDVEMEDADAEGEDDE